MSFHHANVIQISSFPDCQIWKIKDNKRQRVSFGTLQILKLEKNDVHFFHLHTYINTLENTTLMHIEFPDVINLVFPDPQGGLQGLAINRNDKLTDFIMNLSKIVNIVPYDEAIKFEEVNDILTTHAYDIKERPLLNEGQSLFQIKKSANILSKSIRNIGGEKLKKQVQSLIQTQKIINLNSADEKLLEAKQKINKTVKFAEFFVKVYVITPISKQSYILKQKLEESIDPNILESACKYSNVVKIKVNEAVNNVKSYAFDLKHKLQKENHQILSKNQNQIQVENDEDVLTI